MVVAPFLFPMTRIFVKLVKFRDMWGLNVFLIDPVEMTVEQITTTGHSQTAKISDFKYHEDDHLLIFVAYDKIEEFQIYEINHTFWNNLCKPDNWKNLCHGLKIKSEKTAQYLWDRGIRN